MNTTRKHGDQNQSFPLRERGLKPDHLLFYLLLLQSFPLRERGLKQLVSSLGFPIIWSFPLRERGLKPIPVHCVPASSWSFPLRERGLKLTFFQAFFAPDQVVPLAGTWIETPHSSGMYRCPASFPLRERGLKPVAGICHSPA